MMLAMERKLISELIEVYNSHTCLWKIKDPNYKNKEMKNDAYESLLRLMNKYNENCTIDDLKRKIANLRTCYLREFKKVTDAKKYGGVYEPSLWYYKSLEFLNDQHHNDDKARSCRSYPDNSDEDNESNETQILMYEEQAASEDKDSSSTEPDQPPAASSLPMIMMGGGAASDTVTRCKRRRRMLDTANTYTLDRGYPATVAASAADFYEPQIVGGVGGDPSEPPVADYYDGFGRYVANELRQMDRQSVIIAKRLINEVLFLGQMGMLNVYTRIETPAKAAAATGKRNKCGKGAAEKQRHDDQSPPLPPVEFMETS